VAAATANQDAFKCVMAASWCFRRWNSRDVASCAGPADDYVAKALTFAGMPFRVAAEANAAGVLQALAA
jgi:hypothetical protein